MEFRLPGPTIDTDEPQANYPTAFPDYTFGYDIELNSSAGSDWLSYDAATNEIVLQAYDTYYNDIFTAQPEDIWVSVKVAPTWNGSTRSEWPGNFKVIFNDRYGEIGSACGLDLSTFEAEDSCADGSLVDPNINELFELEVGASEAVTFTLPEV